MVFTHPSVDRHWIVFTFWHIEVMLLGTFVYNFFPWTFVFISLGPIPRCGIGGTDGNFVCPIGQLGSSCTTLNSLQQCVNSHTFNRSIYSYQVISSANLGVFEGIGCSEFDATSQFSDVHEVRGCHLVNFRRHVLISFRLLFSIIIAPGK